MGQPTPCRRAASAIAGLFLIATGAIAIASLIPAHDMFKEMLSENVPVYLDFSERQLRLPGRAVASGVIVLLALLLYFGWVLCRESFAGKDQSEIGPRR